MGAQGLCVFIFRRDFRLEDNTTFIEAMNYCKANGCSLLPLFIFNEAQISPSYNTYFSNNQVQFMVQALDDLTKQISGDGGKIYFVHTKRDDIDVVSKIMTHENVRCVAFNKDITPYALKRDAAITNWCATKDIDVLSSEDYTLLPLEKIKTKTNKPYEVYTPFYRTAIKEKVPAPSAHVSARGIYFHGNVDDVSASLHNYYTRNDEIEIAGGRTPALAILHEIKSGAFRTYEKDRDFPSRNHSTRLSAYLKFGCVSCREAYAVAKYAMGKSSVLVQQIFWREYYYNVGYHFPEVLRGQIGSLRNTPVRGKYEKSQWNDSDDDFDKWKTGKTGFPIVDAAMRCLNATGWMHNRLRMVVAMFLVRHLDIDWRKGEQYFATKLVDYDAINNNQGWCWSLSYRRKLNPFKQTGKFDAQCEFIKMWLPELKDVPVLDIIVWWEKWDEHKETGYPKMMIELPGYRVKYKTYIAGYVRPKDPKTKSAKPSKYPPGKKNVAKYDKKDTHKES